MQYSCCIFCALTYVNITIDMSAKIAPSSNTNDAGIHTLPAGGRPKLPSLQESAGSVKSEAMFGSITHFILSVGKRLNGATTPGLSEPFETDVVFRRQKVKYYDAFFSRCGSCKTSSRKFFKGCTPYFIISWTIFVLISLLAVLDRFLWNVSPRQEFALKLHWSMCQKQKAIQLNTTNETSFKIASGCGNDYFCGNKAQQELLNAKDGPLGCLKEGPWTVPLFDVLSRISGRLIITATSLEFLTVCRCSWNFLASSSIPWLRRYLNNWQQDNITLHKLGGWIIGVCTVIHVWSFFLPSIFNGFTNRLIMQEPFSWPFQITTGMSSVMIAEKYVNWSFDDVWRLFWMTVMLCALIPLTRAAKALAFNYSAMMWLHVFVAVIYFIDSFRRRSHPHVWLYNTPFFIWYILDRIVGLTCYHFSRDTKVRVFRLDDDYQVLMWQHKSIDRVTQTSSGDIYWMKSSKPTKHQTASFCDKNCRRAFEWSHPFTAASVMYTADLSVKDPNTRDRYEAHNFPTIQEPSHVDDPGWEGHRFSMAALIDLHIQRRSTSDIQASRCNTAQLQAELHKLDGIFAISSHETLPAESESEQISSKTSQRQKKDVQRQKKEAIAVEKDDEGNRKGVSDADQETKTTTLQMKKFRSSVFREAHLSESDSMGEHYDKCIVAKIYRNKIKKKSCLRSFFRRTPETEIWERDGKSGETEMDVSGPYQSEYARLKSYLDPNDPTTMGPVVVIASGAGAGIALDTMSLIRGWNEGYGVRLHFPVSIYFSTYSLALMQFVSNSLLTDPVKGVHVHVALTRQEVDELGSAKPTKERVGDLQFSRLDLTKAVEDIEDERTAIFFCGSEILNHLLKEVCVKKGLAFYGSAVE